MNVDEMAIELRPRTAREATDLGIALLRHFWRPTVVAWLGAIAALLVVSTAVYAVTHEIILGLLTVWLLKPACDRLPLFVLSRSVFGDTPGAIRSLRYLARQFATLGLWSTCTFRRFSMYRLVSIPVRELEGTTGTRRKRRLSEILDSKTSQSAAGLLMVGGFFELLVLVGLYAGIWMLIPAEFRPIDFINPDNIAQLHSADLMLLGSYTLSYAFAGPLVVAGGFGQYLNRRVALEGWDVELTFRRMSRRLDGQSSHSDSLSAAHEQPSPETPTHDGSTDTTNWRGLALIFSALTALALIGSTPTASAADGATRDGSNADAPDPTETARAVVDDPQFGEKKTKTVRRLKDEYKPDDDSASNEVGQALGQTVGVILEILLWGIAAAGLGFLAWVLIRSIDPSELRRDDDGGAEALQRTSQPSPDHSLRLSDDIAAAAEEALGDGRPIEALSLLYRGTLESLSDTYGLEVTPGMTARTCAQHVDDIDGPADFMHELAEAWLSTVYADRTPSDERIQDLIRAWRREFQRRRREADS